MDVEKTKAFYDQIKCTDLCKCDYCKNYVREIKVSYPTLAEYLNYFVIDIYPIRLKWGM